MKPGLGRYQAYMLAWSGRVDPDGNSYQFYKTKTPLDWGVLPGARPATACALVGRYVEHGAGVQE
jgi:hypothetical protein